MVKSSKTKQSIYKAPRLSPRETEVLVQLERDRRFHLTLEELAEGYGRARAYEVVRSLTKKGVIERVGRGQYVAHPFRAIGRRWTPSAVVVVSRVLGQPHYLGGLWAWSYHHLTSQMHSSRIDAFVTRWRPPREIANARVFFHRIPKENFGYGVQNEHIENELVQVSDLERTLLDALDYPSSIGSVSHSVERVTGVLEKADPARLISYAARGSRSSTCQRLGVLLGRQGVSLRALAPLRRKAARSKSVLSLLPDRPRIGPINPNWSVVENDERRGD